jgi:putative acetyltransferase
MDSSSHLNKLILQRANSNELAFKKLIKELDLYLETINGEQNNFFMQHNTTDKISHVIIALQNNLPAGCGAIKQKEEGIVEVKRMFVSPSCRNQGIGSKILNELELWALELGNTKCVLETSKTMQSANALYEKNNYKVIPNFEPYIGIDTSICYEKLL